VSSSRPVVFPTAEAGPNTGVSSRDRACFVRRWPFVHPVRSSHTACFVRSCQAGSRVVAVCDAAREEVSVIDGRFSLGERRASR